MGIKPFSVATTVPATKQAGASSLADLAAKPPAIAPIAAPMAIACHNPALQLCPVTALATN